MREHTAQLIRELQEADWFSNVGSGGSDSGLVYVFSWGEAARRCAEPIWESVELGAKNRLTNELSARFRDEYQEWSNRLSQVKERLLPIVEHRVGPVTNEFGLPQDVVHSVRWDLLGACMEYEYEHLVSPNFFANLAKFYLLGRFPCGWDGPYPEGRLVLF